MQDKTRFVVEALQKAGLSISTNLETLGSGEAHENFLAELEGEKIVVRTLRDDVPVISGFSQEHTQYRFLEWVGIDFAPRTIMYLPKEEIHVVSFVPGADASVLDLDVRQRENFISLLSHLDTITYSSYKDFCDEIGSEPKVPQKWSEREQINIFDRLAYIESCMEETLAEEVLEWSKEKIKRYNATFENAETSVQFLHGDLRWNKDGGNLRIDKENIIFIDWEMSRFVEDPLIELGDIIGSIPDSLQNEKLISDLLRHYSKMVDEKSSFNARLERTVLYNKLGGPLWACERYLKTKQANMPNIERYESLTRDKMHHAEYYFEKPFNDWFLEK